MPETNRIEYKQELTPNWIRCPKNIKNLFERLLYFQRKLYPNVIPCK